MDIQFPEIGPNSVYLGMVDGIPATPPDVGWYAPEGVIVAASNPPTDAPGQWWLVNGEWQEYTEEDVKQLRVNEIKSRLNEIDLESVRPLRAKVHGTATPDDDAKLAALEQEAEALRSELAGLS